MRRKIVVIPLLLGLGPPLTLAAFGYLTAGPPPTIVPPSRNPVGYHAVQVPVSDLPGAQNGVVVTIDPVDPRILLAGSNTGPRQVMETYTSNDGGASWTASADPPIPMGGFAGTWSSHPAVAIDRTGRQYYAYLLVTPHGASRSTQLFVGTRDAPVADWTVPREPQIPSQPGTIDGREALAVDTSRRSAHEGRVYLAWSRSSPRGSQILLARSDDQAQTFSPPVVVNDRPGRHGASAPTLSLGRDGSVYVAWQDLQRATVSVDRSRDGGARFGRDRVIRLRGHAVRTAYAATSRSVTPESRLDDPTLPARTRRAIWSSCTHQPAAFAIPAQPLRCVTPTPQVVVDPTGGPNAGRVYVTYADQGPNATLDVFVASFDRRLRAVPGIGLRHRVHPRDSGRTDQFLPASTVDADTGAVWTCFYDTTGLGRGRTRYTCAASVDGARRFGRPQPAAAQASDERRPQASPFGYGDYAGVAAARGVAYPVWTDARDLARTREEIYTTTLPEPITQAGGARRPARRPGAGAAAP